MTANQDSSFIDQGSTLQAKSILEESMLQIVCFNSVSKAESAA